MNSNLEGFLIVAAGAAAGIISGNFIYVIILWIRAWIKNYGKKPRTISLTIK